MKTIETIRVQKVELGPCRVSTPFTPHDGRQALQAHSLLALEEILSSPKPYSYYLQPDPDRRGKMPRVQSKILLSSKAW